MVFLSEYRCELVHDTTFHTAIVVFGRLSDTSEFEFVDLAVVEHIVQRESIAALKSG